MSAKVSSLFSRWFTVLTLFLGMFCAPGSIAVVSAASSGWLSSGPKGGSILALVIDPVTPTTLYAGTDGHGVFKSTDSGENWKAVNTSITTATVNALVIDPTEPSTLYAGTNGSGIFRSTDGGENWAEVNTGLMWPPVDALVIDPATPETLYAGMGDAGVFKSMNGGDSWSEINIGLTDDAYIVTLAIDPSAPSILYAGGWGGVFKSTDHGDNWIESSSGLPSTWIYALAIDPVTPSTLYAGTREGQIFKSIDSGGDWSPLDIFLPDADILALAIDRAAPDTLYAGTWGSGIYKSTDGGDTWSASNTGMSQMFIHAVVIDPATPSTSYAGSAGGVFKSIDGSGHWSTVNTGLEFLSVYTLAIDPLTSATLYAATSAGVFKSTDSGGHWSVMNIGLTAPGVWSLAIDPSNPEVLYAAGSWMPRGGGVFKSTDGAETWSPVTTGLSTFPNVNALAVDPSTPSTIYAQTWQGVYKSMNGGDDWSLANQGLPDGVVVYMGQGALVIDPTSPTTLYVGADFGLYKSTNGAESWFAVNSGLPSNVFVHALAIDPNMPEKLFLGTDDGVFLSMDGGENWSQVADMRLQQVDVRTLIIDPLAPTTLYVGAYQYGVFRSTDSGNSWTELNDGLITRNVLALATSQQAPNNLYAGLEAGGIAAYAKSVSRPGMPALLRPASGSLVKTLQPILDWKDSSPLAHHYQIQISTSSTFTTTMVNEPDISESTFTPTTDLFPGKLYYWRVKAFNVLGGASAWSRVWTFKTPLAQPELVAPAMEAVLTTDRPAFEWNPVDGATQYNLQVSASANFATMLVNATVTGHEYTTTKDLPQNRKLYWRVRGKSPVVIGPWSVKGPFKTGNPATVPVLAAPANGALSKDYTPTLNWNNSKVPAGTLFQYYEIQIDEDKSFASPETYTTTPGNLNDSEFTRLTDLASNTKFYWRVRAWNDVNGVDHTSGWSPVWSFRTIIPAPTGLTATPDTLQPTFQWNTAAGPGVIKGYTIQVSTSASFSSFLVNSITQKLFYEMTKNLPSGKLLYWRLRVNGENGPSAWTTVQYTTP